MCHLQYLFRQARGQGQLQAQIFVRIVIPTILDGFQYKFAQLFSIMGRCAILNTCSGRPKVKGQGQTGLTCPWSTTI